MWKDCSTRYDDLTVSGVELHPELLLLLLVSQEGVVGAARRRRGRRGVHQVHVVLHSDNCKSMSIYGGSSDMVDSHFVSLQGEAGGLTFRFG